MYRKKPRPASTALFAMGLTLLLASCAVTPDPPISPSAVPELRQGSGYLSGYLSQNDLPRSDIFLPEAPQRVESGSTDELAARAAFESRSLPRWKLAATDANLKFPAAARHFSCALGFDPTETATPHLLMLLRRTMADAGLSTYAAKNRYNRIRPFAHLKQQSCTPEEEAFLARDGSYPSGHAAAGWAWALILAELEPSRRDDILKRGYSFGQSRVACGVHWQSDVDAGRVVGAATVSALKNNEVFLAQMTLAKKEIAARIKEKQTPPEYCNSEESILKHF